MRIILCGLFVFSVIGLLGCCDKCDNCDKLKTENQALLESVEKLKAEAKAPEKSAKEAVDEDECKKNLADCMTKLEKCEKDPFTGGKYLTGEQKK